MKEQTRIISTEEELKVFSDPFRLSIISAYRDSENSLTVTGCAEILKVAPAKVHYHVKKLLKHEMLVLDRIEVVNGINAKYYKLPHSNFTIQLKADEEGAMQKRLNHVNNVVVSLMEGFKTSFIQNAQEAAKQKNVDASQVGTMTMNDVYLSPEEYKEFEELIYSLGNDYKTEDASKKKYSLLVGITTKQ